MTADTSGRAARSRPGVPGSPGMLLDALLEKRLLILNGREHLLLEPLRPAFRGGIVRFA